MHFYEHLQGVTWLYITTDGVISVCVCVCV